MGLDVTLVVETIAKLVIFLPIMGLVGWWLFWAWVLDKSIHIEEFAVGAALWTIAFCFGLKSIVSRGWGIFPILGLVYLALMSVGMYEYLHWRRVEMQHLQREARRYQRAIENDPTAQGAYSLLGETYLKLRQYEEAEEALATALKMDPESKPDRRLLERARRREGGPPKWWRTD